MQAREGVLACRDGQLRGQSQQTTAIRHWRATRQARYEKKTALLPESKGGSQRGLAVEGEAMVGHARSGSAASTCTVPYVKWQNAAVDVERRLHCGSRREGGGCFPPLRTAHGTACPRGPRGMMR